MSDIAVVWDSTLNVGDLAIEANDLEQDAGLETAVCLSLFLDRRAEPGDVLPDDQTDRRGWWADTLPVIESDKIGSRLWLLSRSKQTQDVLTRAVEYAREALQWMIDDKVTDRIDVSAEVVASGILGLAVVIYRPTAGPVEYRYTYNWAAQQARRG